MILFAETPELVAYKEVIGETVVVTFESMHSETFSITAQVRSDLDIADSLFMTGWQQYMNEENVS